jgi:hypothetical protein
VDLNEANKLWYMFQPIEGIKYGLNDSVRIISGEHEGETGSVISLTTIEPPTYLIELSSGQDIEIAESYLILAE